MEVGERPPYWGFSGSPLVYGDRLVWNVGSSGLAVRAVDGEVVWKSATRPSVVWKTEPVGVSGYITPTVVRHEGVDLIALADEARWVLVDPGTGQERWSTSWETPYGVNASQPVVAEGHVGLSGGYGFGTRWVRVGGDGVALWTDPDLRSHFAPLVVREGHLYGIDGNQQDGVKCELRCVRLADGEVRWSRARFGFGNLALVGEWLLVLTARGELVLVAADSAGYREAGRVQVLGGESWTAPVVVGGDVYARNKQGTLVRVRLPGGE